MRGILCGLLLIVAGCSGTPSAPPLTCHICVEIANDLVECEIRESELLYP
jgi:hypothetical protein